jgi:uncharacterized protein YqgC (DUF456 family)
MLALVGGAAKAIGGGIVKNVAKDKAKNFITGKKKKVKPEAIKKGDDSYTPGKGGSSLAVRPKTSLVPEITPVSVSEVSSESKSSGDTLTLIKTKVFEINKFLKGSLAQEKASSKKDKKSDEKQKRKKQESALEKIAPKPKGVLKKITAPAKGLFDGIFNFISNILLGRLLVVLLEKNPNLPGGNLLMFLANMAEKVIDTIIGTLDAFGSFLLFGQQKLDDAKDWLKEHRGNDAVERFDGLLGSLTNLFNAAVIVGSVFAALGIAKPPKGPKKPEGPKGQKPGVKPTKPLIKNPGMKPTGPSKAARLVQKNHGHAARGIYQNSYDNAIAKGRTPRQAAETANASVKKAIEKGRIVSKPQTGSLGGTDKGSKITKGGVKKIPKRLATKVLGKSGIKAIKGIAKGFGRVPIMGPLIVGVASLLAGEPLGQAIFKGLGAALGGFLGTFIPIPVIGTILGEMIGTLVGDMLYSLTMGGGIKEAGQKFMTAVKSALDVGGLIVNFFKEGFGRFFNDFPTVDVPGVMQSPLALLFPFLATDGAKGFFGENQVKEMPNLSILFNPVAMLTELIPHAAASFLPDIFGSGGTAFGSSNSSESKEPDKSTGGDTPAITGSGDELGLDKGTGANVTGASGKGMKTGPAGYDRIGAGAAYHVDTKFHQSIGMGGMISAMDKMADAYTAKNKEIVFSGAGPARLQAYKSNLEPDRKKFLITEAIRAHSHSSFMRAEGFKPFDYYIPDISANKDLYHPSTEGAEILLPEMGGEVKVGSAYGGYGKSAEIFDTSGKMVAMTGHGDLAYYLGGFTKSMAHRAILGEEGREFVMDADSTAAIESAFPGLLSEINKAKGKSSIESLMEYTDYERPPEPEMAMAGSSSSGGSDSYGDSGESGMVSSNVSEESSGTDSSWKDIRYKFG